MNIGSCPTTGQLISTALAVVNDPNCVDENSVVQLNSSSQCDNVQPGNQDPIIVNLENQIRYLQQQSQELHSQVLSQQEIIRAFQQNNCNNLVSDSMNDGSTQNQGECSNSKRKRLLSNEKNSVQETSYNIPISNSFTPLLDLENENDTVNVENIKIPPINVNKSPNIINNFGSFIAEIQSIATQDFDTKIKQTHISIFFKSIIDFRNYRRYCDTNKIQYFSYRDPTKKRLSALIYDVPISYTNEEIKLELTKNYPVTEVYRLFGKNREHLEICAIELLDNDQGREIIKLNRLFNSVIKTKFKNKTLVPLQCKNCQRFNHTQANCKMESRCVRCTGSHHYKYCNKPKTSTPQCVNCLLNHTANYRGCMYFKNISFSNIDNIQNYSSKRTQLHPQLHTATKHQYNNNARSPPDFNDPKSFPNLPSPPLLSQTFLNKNIATSTVPSIDLSTFTSKITSEIINALIPQIQKLIQQILPTYINNG